jgi:hypothetical protein
LEFVWRGLRFDEDTGSGSEVNRLVSELVGEGLPSVDFAHGDLTGGKQRPEQHCCGLGRGQSLRGLATAGPHPPEGLMVKSRPLTIEDVSQLGAEQLARLLLEAAEDDPALMRTVRIAVASRTGAAQAAAQIDAEIKRIKRKGLDRLAPRAAFARDLTALHDAIEGPLADADPLMALERIFDFIDLAPSVIERSENSDGTLGNLFHGACEAAARLAAKAAPAFPLERAAFRAYQTYLSDDYGIADSIVAAFARSVDDTTRAVMRSWIEADLARLAPPANPANAAEPLPEWKLVHALGDMADAAGDVDAYCAAQQRLGPRVRGDAGMARRLFDAGRPAEAYAVIQDAQPNPAKNGTELADLRIAALSALGRRDEAQAARWQEFARTLREEPLREFLKHLPDFEDTEKEREALAFAGDFSDPHRALEFLTNLARFASGGGSRATPFRCDRWQLLLDPRSGRGPAGSERAARGDVVISSNDRLHARSSTIEPV